MFRLLFERAGLSRLVKDIDFLAKDSIRLHTKVAGEYDLSIGASRIGGVPDVPPDFKWPERNAMPQSFVAQIYLDEVHPYDTHGALPARGILWFFYDAKRETYGADPADRGGWSVLFSRTIPGYNVLLRLPNCPPRASLKPAPSALPPRSLYRRVPSLMFPILTGRTTKCRNMRRCCRRFPLQRIMALCLAGCWGIRRLFRMICGWSAS